MDSARARDSGRKGRLKSRRLSPPMMSSTRHLIFSEFCRTSLKLYLDFMLGFSNRFVFLCDENHRGGSTCEPSWEGACFFGPDSRREAKPQRHRALFVPP